MAAPLTPEVLQGEQLANRVTLGQEISALIKQGIATGTLMPGQRIVESKLAQELGVSLTPVREAVRQLVGEGILTVVPNRGPSVRVLTEEDTFELYSLRAMLEGLAIRLAVTRSPVEDRNKIRDLFAEMVTAVDDDAVPSLLAYSTQLHEGIVQLSDHERLITVYQSLALQIAILNRVAGQQSTKQHEVDWHRPLVEALFGDDPNDAERVIRAHVYDSYLTYNEMVGAAETASVPSHWF